MYSRALYWCRSVKWFDGWTLPDVVAHVETFPRYLGMLRPRTRRSAKLYYYLSIILRPISYWSRRRAASVLKQSDAANALKDNGYLMIDLRSDPVVQRALDYCEQVMQTEAFREDARKSKNPAIQTYEFDLDDPAAASIADLIVHPPLLAAITRYLGGVPVLQRAAISVSPNEKLAGGTQLFHLDKDDYRQVKCNIFIDDVTEECGPMTIIPAKESTAIYNALGAQGARRIRTLSDDEVFAVSSLKKGVPLCGERGEASLVDTCRCYHYGSRPSPRRRVLLYLHYATVFSTAMPIAGEKLFLDRRNKSGVPQGRVLRDLVLEPRKEHFSKARKAVERTRHEKIWRDIERLVPKTSKLILVDDGILADGAPVSTLPFLEKDGAYWGAPADSETAISELRRMRAEGAAYFGIAWPSFWWMNAYPAFHMYLHRHFRCVADNECLVLYDLKR